MQAVMQQYGEDKGLEWSMDKSAVMRRWGEAHMAIDTEALVRWLEKAQEANVLGKTQTMWVAQLRPPEELIKGFKTIMVVLQMYPPSLHATIYYFRFTLNGAVGYQVMHLPRW